jgi:hypothetical protein
VDTIPRGVPRGTLYAKLRAASCGTLTAQQTRERVGHEAGGGMISASVSTSSTRSGSRCARVAQRSCSGRRCSSSCSIWSAGAIRVVSKREILEAIWPDSVVTDGSIERAVSLARRAIGDSGGRRAVIARHRWRLRCGGPRRFRDPARVADPRREARDLASSQPRGGTVEDSRLIEIVIGFVSEPETAQ